MRRVKVLQGPVRIPAGCQIKMNVEQAAARIHAVTALSGGVYQTKEPTEWKTGEVFETDVEFGKGLADHVEVTEPEKPKSRKRDDTDSR